MAGASPQRVRGRSARAGLHPPLFMYANGDGLAVGKNAARLPEALDDGGEGTGLGRGRVCVVELCLQGTHVVACSANSGSL